MVISYRVLEIHRIGGSCNPIVVTVYRVTEEEKSAQFTIYLSPEEFCEHIFKHIMTSGAGTEVMFDRLLQLYQLRYREIEEVGKRLTQGIVILPEPQTEDDFIE